MQKKNPAPETETVSVAIVNYYSTTHLTQCLNCILQTRFEGNLEIIVVNNSPGDGAEELIAAKFPEVRLLSSPENLGFGPACNLALREATGEFFLLVNPDAYIPANAVQISLDYFRQNPKVGILGAQLLTEDGVWQPSARGFPTFWDKWFMLSGLADRFPRNRLFGRMNRTWWDHSHAQSVDWVVGAYFMIRSDLFWRLNGFDPRFFLYYEELDLCRGAKKLGWEVHYLPEIEVHHIGGASSDGDHIDRAAVDGAQITIFRLFSEALYYGKHHGRLGPWVMLGLERFWFRLRWLKNRFSGNEIAKKRAPLFARHIRKIKFALKETRYGQVIPKQPWSTDLTRYKNWSD